MELIKKTTNIDFLGRVKLFTIISSVCIVLSILLLIFKGINFGLDFTGGTTVQIKSLEGNIDIAELDRNIKAEGLNSFVVQTVGSGKNQVIVKLGTGEASGNLSLVTESLGKAFDKTFSSYDLLEVNQVGPRVGNVLKQQAYLAILYAILAILVYIAIRFEFAFSIGAVIALCHDVVLSLGIYSLFGLEFNLVTVAAILTLVGYSLNDTIVIFDRVREVKNEKKNVGRDLKSLMNEAINKTLSRTVITSLLTLLAGVALLILGGSSLRGFATIIVIGVIIGTYSSIAIACTAVYKIVTRPKKLTKSESQLVTKT